MSERLAASPAMEAYFRELKAGVTSAFGLAQEARKEGYDPDSVVEVALAENLAERVIGLISVVAPQIRGSGVVERILELEQQYGKLDWRVALTIALEVAQEKYCKFQNTIEAIETGIRVGFAYVTVGVVSSPLEGFTKLELKRRNDGKGEYFSIFYSGPIRNAGGTAAAVSVLIADYLRKQLGYAAYDPTEKEVKRCAAELEDYHNFITNLQYFPSEEETTFLMEHMPIEIDGEESEKYEVSNVNLKDLPRVKANKLRNGYCLIHSSCIPLKGPKLWAKLEKWGHAFGLDDWDFLKEFVVLQKRMKAKGKKEETAKLVPDYTYIKDLVAGRPVFAHPMRPGGWRLRYGRSRASGYSGQAVHPASMAVLNNFLATGTQLKVERPGKAAAFTPCDSIDGPIVLLKDGSVVRLSSEQQARRVLDQLKEILYLGDVLINYGDFFDRAHTLVPPGYCQEFWIAELEKAAQELGALLDLSRLAAITGVERERLELLFKRPMATAVPFGDAVRIAQSTKTPLHPHHTLFWKLLSREHFCALVSALCRASREPEKLIIPFRPETDGLVKNALETLGVEHLLVENEFLVLEHDAMSQLLVPLGFSETGVLAQRSEEVMVVVNSEEARRLDTLALVNLLSPFALRDKAGVFIGSRMGRPEKAKMRKMTGSPHTLFPVGDEGGRLRSFQAAFEAGKVTSAFPICFCPRCRIETPLFRCERCDGITVRLKYCPTCGTVDDCPHTPAPSSVRAIDIKALFDGCLAKLNTSIYPDLIKGVRGTSNSEHIPEHPIKGILRAKHGIHVNKDGTLRYDASEVTLTHFKPREVCVGVERLRQLGYTHDIHGEALVQEEQVLELKVQDVVLPCCVENPEEPADKVFCNTANFVDELLVKLYGKEPFYSLKGPQDLVGQLIVGLAPHTSAGILGRIVGFSKTQGFLAHPYFHAAMRRDCDGDEACFLLLMDAFLNFSRKYLSESRGSTMDAPLVLTSILAPAEVDDMAFHVDIAWKYPLEFYLAALEYKKPWEVSVPQIKEVLGTPAQYEGMGYTHETSDINMGVRCSAYKLLPSMEEKMQGQMDLAVKIRACDASDVARLVIEKHFIRDTRGNLRKFSQQQYRCVNCNEKFRRPPLRGNCTHCGGKIIFTISEGSVVKYLEPSISLANKFNVPVYLKQSLELTKRQIESIFGRDAELQEGLGKWFG
jgi:DNA polymerase II large subunit